MPLRRSEQWFQQNPHEGEALQQAYRELEALRSELQAARDELVEFKQVYGERITKLHDDYAAAQEQLQAARAALDEAKGLLRKVKSRLFYEETIEEVTAFLAAQEKQ